MTTLTPEERFALRGLARSYAMPGGRRILFRFTEAGEIVTDWLPAPPDVPRLLRSPRAARKLLEAYRAARDAFAQELAAAIGCEAVVLDEDGETPTTIIRPPPVH